MAMRLELGISSWRSTSHKLTAARLFVRVNVDNSPPLPPLVTNPHVLSWPLPNTGYAAWFIQPQRHPLIIPLVLSIAQSSCICYLANFTFCFGVYLRDHTWFS